MPTAKQSFSNTNRWDTRTLVTMALMCALSVLISFIEFPIIPGVAFLKLDVSIMVAMVAGFAYGAGPGCIVGVAAAVIHGLIMGDPVGALMNTIVTICMVAPSSAVYARNRTFAGALTGLVLASVLTIAAAIVSNLIVDPALYGYPFDAVVALIPALLVFNAIKAVANSVLTVLVYKSVKNLVTPAKERVVGR